MDNPLSSECEEIPTCPICGVNPCIWDKILDDWAYCLKCQTSVTANRHGLIDDSVLSSVGIPSRYFSADLSDFSLEDMGGIKIDKGVLVTGKVGAGKTHLLCALCKHMLSIGKGVLFIPCTALMSTLKESGFKGGEEYVDRIIKVECLFLDDFGTQGNSEWVYGIFYRIINERYNRNSYTGFSINGNLKDVCDDRIRRRITEMTRRFTL